MVSVMSKTTKSVRFLSWSQGGHSATLWAIWSFFNIQDKLWKIQDMICYRPHRSIHISQPCTTIFGYNSRYHPIIKAYYLQYYDQYILFRFSLLYWHTNFEILVCLSVFRLKFLRLQHVSVTQTPHTCLQSSDLCYYQRILTFHWKIRLCFTLYWFFHPQVAFLQNLENGPNFGPSAQDFIFFITHIFDILV